MVMMVVAIVVAILAPIMARLLYFAISRKREYLADASAARLTRYPEGLASALEKIASSNLDLASANKVTAPMYIANPLKKKGRKLSNLTSTHPPITERIQILRSMSHGVNFLDYQKAYSVAKGKSSPIVPTSELAKTADIPIRKPSAEKEEKRGKKKERKQTTQGRDGRTVHRHHTGIFLRRGECGASRRPPLGVCLFLSLFAVCR